jgi:hypothetical protein
MRYNHLLRRAKASGQPSQYIGLALEVEWIPEPGPARQERARLARWAVCGASGRGGHYGADVERQGTTKEEFWEGLLHAIKRRGPIWVICEDAALAASLLDVWSLLERGALIRHVQGDGALSGRHDAPASRRVDQCIIEDVPFVLDCRPREGGGRIRWVDKGNYALPPCEANAPVTGRALRMSATLRHMVGVLQSEGHMTHPVVCHADGRALALEEDAYYGGRCEAYRLGGLPGRVYHLDVCAQYGAACCAALLPVALVGTGTAGERLSGTAERPDRGLLARVTLRSADRAFPRRDRDRGVVCWPSGQWYATLAGPELQRALSDGSVTHVHEWAEYDLAPALASVAAHYLRLRAALKDDADLSGWAKMLANALVGKLGARDRRWVDSWSDMPGPAWYQWIASPSEHTFERWRRIAGQDQRQVSEGFAPDAIPAMAAWITSLGRMQLLGYIRCAGWDHVHYVDTDALMVDQVGYDALCAAGHVLAGVPGKLRIKEVCDAVAVYGLRDYTVRATPAHPARGEACGPVVPMVPTVSAVPGPLASLRAGRGPQATRHALAHTRSGLYRHGVRRADGSVSPFEVWEGS